jgi:hypothetical protein
LIEIKMEVRGERPSSADRCTEADEACQIQSIAVAPATFGRALAAS